MCLGHQWVICAASCLGLSVPAKFAIEEISLLENQEFIFIDTYWQDSRVIIFFAYMNTGFAALGSKIQSIIWTGLGIAGALVYLNVITVTPYNEPKDFFRVTLAKLYFEGPNSEINGNYLGQFEKDYRNPDKIDLFHPNNVFAISVAYVIINVFYFFLSILLCSNRKWKNPYERRRFLDISLGWGFITFILCAIDAMFLYYLIRDFLQIMDYVNDSLESKIVANLVFIPLILALVPGRIVILWIWNFVIACLLFFDAFCCKRVLRESFQPDQEVKQEQKAIGPPKSSQVPPVKLINKSYSSSYDIQKERESIEFRKSMEAVTSFSDDCGKSQAIRVYSPYSWQYAHSRDSFEDSKCNLKENTKEWAAINEAYEFDEAGSVVLEQNLQSGQKEIKVMKPLIGKPVEEQNLKETCNETSDSSAPIESVKSTD